MECIFSFSGMILTVQPWSDMASGPDQDTVGNHILDQNLTRISDQNNSTDNDIDDDWVQHYMIGYIAVAINIMLTGVFLIFHKQKLADLDVVTLVFWATTLGIPMSAALMLYFNTMILQWNGTPMSFFSFWGMESETRRSVFSPS